MSRNFGAGNRDMGRAGEHFAREHYDSYSSVATVSDRFNSFVEFAKDAGCKKLEDVTKETVESYAQSLKEQEYSPATAQNYLSAVNVIMAQARGDNDVRVTGKEAGLEARTGVATDYKGGQSTEGWGEKQSAIYELGQTLGLRFEEASKLDIQQSLSTAESRGSVVVENGTKGGQTREVPASPQAVEALRNAKEVAGESPNLIGNGVSYASHQDAMYRNGEKYHSARHEYANERYAEIMAQHGVSTVSPVQTTDKNENQTWAQHLAEKTGLTPAQAREVDALARSQVAEELGHHREEITNAYIGGQG